MASIALDTNIAIDVLNGHAPTVGVLQAFDDLYLPVVVCGELLFGARNSARSATNEEHCQALIERCSILESSYLVAQQYATVRLALKQRGRPIPENDIWIAAACITYKIALFTRDAHFEFVEGLSLAEHP